MKRFTFAIGDIHGRLDLLEKASEVICDYLAEREATGRVICLGDYVDRGPDSRDVIEFLMESQKESGASLTCLKGNHEVMMLTALAAPGFMDWWKRHGGEETLKSYGFDKVPQAHIDWLKGLPTIAQDDLRLYVHAGFFPGRSLDEQTEDDEEGVLWIRDRFLLGEKQFVGWPHIVHGHTPTHPWKPNPAEPELLGWRTNLDTAAHRTGVLAVGVFTDEQGPPIEVLKVTL